MKDEIQVNHIHCTDAFELLSKPENGIVDLIICDGPYSVTASEWDKVDNIQNYNLNLIKIFSEPEKSLCGE